ncbi:MAG: hypothetical protein Q9191_005641 [Dirinaria sp. TL-2023a]
MHLSTDLALISAGSGATALAFASPDTRIPNEINLERIDSGRVDPAIVRLYPPLLRSVGQYVRTTLSKSVASSRRTVFAPFNRSDIIFLPVAEEGKENTPDAGIR